MRDGEERWVKKDGTTSEVVLHPHQTSEVHRIKETSVKTGPITLATLRRRLVKGPWKRKAERERDDNESLSDDDPIPLDEILPIVDSDDEVEGKRFRKKRGERDGEKIRQKKETVVKTRRIRFWEKKVKKRTTTKKTEQVCGNGELRNGLHMQTWNGFQNGEGVDEGMKGGGNVLIMAENLEECS